MFPFWLINKDGWVTTQTRLVECRKTDPSIPGNAVKVIEEKEDKA